MQCSEAFSCRIMPGAGLFMIAGVVNQLAAVSMANWSSVSVDQVVVKSVGLWRGCDLETCTELAFTDESLSDGLRACKAFGILAVLASFLAIGLTLYHVGAPCQGRRQYAILPIISSASCLASSCFLIIATAIWYRKIEPSLQGFTFDSALYFSCLGIMFVFIAAVMAFFARRVITDLEGVPRNVDRTLPGGMSLIALPALATIALGNYFYLFGITSSWSKRKIGGVWDSFGVWDYCPALKCEKYTFTDIPFSSSIRACQAFTALGMLSSSFGEAAAFLCILTPFLCKARIDRLPIVSFICCAVSLPPIVLSVIIWAASVHGTLREGGFVLDASFYLSFVGGILVCFGGALIYVSGRRKAIEVTVFSFSVFVSRLWIFSAPRGEAPEPSATNA